MCELLNKWKKEKDWQGKGGQNTVCLVYESCILIGQKE